MSISLTEFVKIQVKKNFLKGEILYFLWHFWCWYVFSIPAPFIWGRKIVWFYFISERMLLKSVFSHLCVSFQEALTVYKEAIQKMPRQFAPQSLYNMMGKCIVSASEWYLRSKGETKDLIQATGAQINELIKPKNTYLQ